MHIAKQLWCGVVAHGGRMLQCGSVMWHHTMHVCAMHVCGGTTHVVMHTTVVCGCATTCTRVPYGCAHGQQYQQGGVVPTSYHRAVWMLCDTPQRAAACLDGVCVVAPRSAHTITAVVRGRCVPHPGVHACGELPPCKAVLGGSSRHR